MDQKNPSFPGGVEADRVLSFRDWCQLCGFSVATGRRLLKSGRGPVVTRLSDRRQGITVRNHHRWIEARSNAAAQ